MTGASPLPAVLVVMGVSGSGKSTVASELAKRLGWEFEDGDWFHPAANVEKMKSGQPLTDDDRKPWLAAIAAWIVERRDKGEHGVVACSALKRAYRDVLVGGDPRAARIVYLNGSKELIATRLALRHGHFMPAGLLDSQFAALEPPTPDEHPIAVSIDAHPRSIVGTLLDRMRGEFGDLPGR